MRFSSQTATAAPSPVIPEAGRTPPLPPIKLSPGGYFAPHREFEQNYERVINGLADYWIAQMQKTGKRLPVLVLMDDSPLGKRYLPRVIASLNERQLDVYTHKTNTLGETPLPLGYLGFFVKNFKQFNFTDEAVVGGVMLTAGSRSWDVGGIRFVNRNGALFSFDERYFLENSIFRQENLKLEINSKNNRGKRIDVDLEKGVYFKHLIQLINYNRLELSKAYPFHDARHGATRNEFQKRIPALRCTQINTASLEPPTNPGQFLKILKNSAGILSLTNITFRLIKPC